MRILFHVLIVLLVSSLPLSAEEEYISLKDFQPAEVAPETLAHGCYYHRGRRFCARYCYWEVNGRRYCQERLRQAHSQSYYYLDEEGIAPEVHYRSPRR